MDSKKFSNFYVPSIDAEFKFLDEKYQSALPTGQKHLQWAYTNEIFIEGIVDISNNSSTYLSLIESIDGVNAKREKILPEILDSLGDIYASKYWN